MGSRKGEPSPGMIPHTWVARLHVSEGRLNTSSLGCPPPAHLISGHLSATSQAEKQQFDATPTSQRRSHYTIFFERASCAGRDAPNWPFNKWRIIYAIRGRICTCQVCSIAWQHRMVSACGRDRIRVKDCISSLPKSVP